MTTYPSASIFGTETRTIGSRHVNQEYRISIAFPRSYRSEPQKTYPVIYVTDAYWEFGVATGLTRNMALCGRFPETIVVGIGYPFDEPFDNAFQQIVALRTRDLTPVVDRNTEEYWEKYLKMDHVQTGGAKQFLQFIKSELIPMIESEFRVSPTDRVLAGHSYGGLFVLYALFHQPRLFNGYVAGSPSLGYGDKVTFEHESQFASTHKSLPVKLYICAGGWKRR